MRSIVPVLLLVLVLTISINTREGVAQNPSQQVCSTFIQDAIRAVGDNCGLLERNTACYGYQAVTASFTEAQANDFFSQPNQRSPIRILSSITTSPLRTALDQWGIALLSVQANLPETLPGQSVIFMLLGDTEVENDVEEQDVYQPGEIIAVTTARADALVYLPRANADVLASIPANASLMADAVSSDGLYARVVYQGVPGWVTVAALQGGVDFAPLAVITPTTRTPGQAFYLRTNIGQTECVQAPDSLVVQGPQNIQIDLRANNADIRIGSTVVLRVIPVIPRLVDLARRQFNITEQVFALLEMTVLDGKAIVDPDTEREQMVFPGQRIYRCLGAADNIALDGVGNDNPVIDSCPWFGLETLTREQIAEFAGLEGIVLNYPIELPEVPDPTPTPIPTSTPGVPVFGFPTNTPLVTPTPLPLATNTPVPPTNPPPTNPPPTSTPPTCLTTIPGFVSTIAEFICEIDRVNVTPGIDTINLYPGTMFTFLTQHNPGNALPVITDPLIINGGNSTLQTTGASDAMRYFETAPGVDLTINALNLRLGTASSPGGAILSQGTLTVNDSSFTSNRSPSGNGGAIWHGNVGALSIRRTLFSGNFASGAGGGVYSEGITTIDESYFANNLAGEGAGLYICASAVITNSAFVSNSNQAVKGCGSSSIRMINSTVSNNSNGVISDASVSLSFVTVYGNDGTGVGAPAGVIRNSIVAANDANCAGGVSGAGSTFSAVNTPCPGSTFVALAALQILTAVPQNNGGSTPTHALGTTSVAIDSVLDCTNDLGDVVTRDQRGLVRPSPHMTRCDAGSFEEQLSSAPVATATPTPTATPDSGSCSPAIPNPAATVAQLICAIELANDEINFPGPNTINLASGATYAFDAPYSFGGQTALPDITSTITVNGALSVLRPASGTLNARLFFVTSTGVLTLNQMNILDWEISGQDGGAIYSRGVLNINATVLSGNEAVGADGGAIYVQSGTLSISNSSLSSNTANFGGAVKMGADTGGFNFSGAVFTDNYADAGGAVYAESGATASISFSRFVDNNALLGAGIHTSRPVNIDHSTFLQGSTELGGTHIYIAGDHTHVYESTLSGANSGTSIYVGSDGGINLLNSTLSGNSSGAARVFGRFDAVFTTIAYNGIFGTRREPDGIVTLRHSLMVANGSANCDNGTSVVSGVSFATDSTCGADVNVRTETQIALTSLANNGGATFTHYPDDDSVVLGTITPSDCTLDGSTPVTIDQRGVTRPAGSNCDPGSVENNTAGGGGVGAPELHTIPAQSPETAPLEPDDIIVLPEPEATPDPESTPEIEPTPEGESTPEVTPDAESTPEVTEDEAVITATPSATLPAPATLVPTATETPEGGIGLGSNFATATPSPTATPTLVPTPASILEPALRALDFTAWVMRR